MSEVGWMLDRTILEECGLHLLAVFALEALPSELYERLAAQVDGLTRDKRLVLVGHGGRQFWAALQRAQLPDDEPDPIDTFSIAIAKRWVEAVAPGAAYEILYPATGKRLPLQQLGALAGWHHEAPFRLGVNARWGSWFAYRVALLIDVDWPPTVPENWAHPCESCVEKPCFSACPVDALAREDMLNRCVTHRLQADSRCARQCHARLACPVASVHRYTTAQLHYHYGRSLQTIQAWRRAEDTSGRAIRASSSLRSVQPDAWEEDG